MARSSPPVPSPPSDLSTIRLLYSNPFSGAAAWQGWTVEAIARFHQALGEQMQDALLALWCPWPILLAEPVSWLARDLRPWRRVTGGAHHGRADAEGDCSHPLLLYKVGKPPIRYDALQNTCEGEIGPWIDGQIGRWTAPGETVATIGAMPLVAQACAAAQRGCVRLMPPRTPPTGDPPDDPSPDARQSRRSGRGRR